MIDSRYSLKDELTHFANRPDVGREGRRSVKDEIRVFGHQLEK